ncbi:MAG: DUF4268 domain-containing protein [Maricaulaceae bacterium]
MQKWILDHPEMLGEELLILQEEFDGWDETRERLDVLAMDKNGRLVVIENKLDDSGKDVVWQALKYAAYCSSLTRQDIIKLYQDYLGPEESSDAEVNMATFLEVEDLSDVEISEGTSQRLILTAAKFRKEVTATCLWLIDHGIDVQCKRITPFSYQDKVLLNVEQVIPPKEAQEFMVRIGRKKLEEQRGRTENVERHRRRLKFWGQLLPTLSQEAEKLFSNRSPGKDHWLSGSTGHSGINHNFHFLKDRIRYELYIGNSDHDYNKHIYDVLLAKKEQLETAFGDALDWRRLDDKKSSRIFVEKLTDSYDEDSWPDAFTWLDEKMNKGIGAFQSELNKLKL